MKYRFVISSDGGSTYDIPVSPSPPGTLIRWNKDATSARSGKRMELGGELRFTGLDFTVLKELRRSNGSCFPVYVRLDLQCGGWKPLWHGRFHVGGGTWDYRKCSVSVKPKPVDRYSCILDNQDRKVNLLLAGVTTARALRLPPNVEFAMCTSILEGCSDIYRSNHGWSVAKTWTPFPGVTYRLYWRERLIMPCLPHPSEAFDIPATPAGSGWQLIANACNPSSPDIECLEPGTALYVRPITEPYTFGDPVQGTFDPDTGHVPPAGCGAALFVGRGYGSAGNPGCSSYPNDIQPGGGEGSWFICLENGANQALTRCRTLKDCLGLLLSRMGCETAGVRSDFFGINPPGDAPGYTPGLNYVTGRPTETEHILLLDKTDAISPTASQPAMRAEMSFKELMKTLGTMYQVQWDIDADGFLRIEHCSYWNNPIGLDLTQVDSDDLVEPHIHTDKSAEVPRVERATFLDAQGVDFSGMEIKYEGACVTDQENGGVVEYNLNDITTDISMILNEPTAVSRKGFVLLACRENAGGLDVIVSSGAITDSPVVNAPMSWANLQRDFWTWNRFLLYGNMNGADTEFDGARPNIEQEGITLLCFGCRALNLNANYRVRTSLGQQRLGGALGSIEQASLDVRGSLRLTAQYVQ
jgi:hypothetical protein